MALPTPNQLSFRWPKFSLGKVASNIAFVHRTSSRSEAEEGYLAEQEGTRRGVGALGGAGSGCWTEGGSDSAGGVSARARCNANAIRAKLSHPPHTSHSKTNVFDLSLFRRSSFHKCLICESSEQGEGVAWAYLEQGPLLFVGDLGVVLRRRRRRGRGRRGGLVGVEEAEGGGLWEGGPGGDEGAEARGRRQRHRLPVLLVQGCNRNSLSFRKKDNRGGHLCSFESG